MSDPYEAPRADKIETGGLPHEVAAGGTGGSNPPAAEWNDGDDAQD